MYVEALRSVQNHPPPLWLPHQGGALSSSSQYHPKKGMSVTVNAKSYCVTLLVGNVMVGNNTMLSTNRENRNYICNYHATVNTIALEKSRCYISEATIKLFTHVHYKASMLG